MGTINSAASIRVPRNKRKLDGTEGAVQAKRDLGDPRSLANQAEAESWRYSTWRWTASFERAIWFSCVCATSVTIRTWHLGR